MRNNYGWGPPPRNDQPSSRRIIHSFTGEYRWLSNFWTAPITARNGAVWPSVEHAYQAMKTVDRGQREMIRAASSPLLAKRLGRTITMRPNWDDLKVTVMEKLVRAKFTQHPDLAAKLIATGDADLIEGHTNDEFWGISKKTHTGLNWLGRILMKVRAELQSTDNLGG